MPKQVSVAATAAVNGSKDRVLNLTILSAKLGTKTGWEKVPNLDGTASLRETSIRTINLRLSQDCIRTSSGYKTNVMNLELSQFENRLGSAESKEIRHLEHKMAEDITVLEDVPVKLFVFVDMDDEGNEVERYKLAF